jgi:hypothetical protein
MELLKHLINMNKHKTTLPPNTSEAIDKAINKFISYRRKEPVRIRISHEMFESFIKSMYPNIGPTFRDEIQYGVFYRGIKVEPTKLSNIAMVLLY